MLIASRRSKRLLFQNFWNFLRNGFVCQEYDFGRPEGYPGEFYVRASVADIEEVSRGSSPTVTQSEGYAGVDLEAFFSPGGREVGVWVVQPSMSSFITITRTTPMKSRLIQTLPIRSEYWAPTYEPMQQPANMAKARGIWMAP